MRRALAVVLVAALGAASAVAPSAFVSLGELLLALALGGAVWPRSSPHQAVAGLKVRSSTRGIEVLGALSLVFALSSVWKLEPLSFPIPWAIALGCAGLVIAVRIAGAELELGRDAIHISRLHSVPYDDIASAEPKLVGRQLMVGLMLERDGRVLASMRDDRRKVFQRQREWRRRNGEADVWIPASLFDVDVHSLADFLKPKR